MTKIAAIGECMVEMVQQKDGLYKRGYAGDTLNMAKYLSWIGADKNIDVYYVTAFGTDKFGREILDRLKQTPLKTDYIMTTDTKNTGLYFADVNDQGNRDYTFYRADSAAKLMFRLPESNSIFSSILKMDAVYASAITMMILNDHDRLELINLFQLARERGLKTIFDTNYRKSGWNSAQHAAEWMMRILPHVDLVLPTNDENAEVFGDPSSQATLDRLKKIGVPEIAVKCGAEDCLVWDHGKQVSVPAIVGIKAIDTTAAGDSFNAGYIAARLKGLPPEQAAQWGHRLAAQVVQHPGAFIDRTAMPVFQL